MIRSQQKGAACGLPYVIRCSVNQRTGDLISQYPALSDTSFIQKNDYSDKYYESCQSVHNKHCIELIYQQN